MWWGWYAVASIERPTAGLKRLRCKRFERKCPCPWAPDQVHTLQGAAGPAGHPRVCPPGALPARACRHSTRSGEDCLWCCVNKTKGSGIWQQQHCTCNGALASKSGSPYCSQQSPVHPLPCPPATPLACPPSPPAPRRPLLPAGPAVGAVPAVSQRVLGAGRQRLHHQLQARARCMHACAPPRKRRVG